jgi:aldehyde dehydrogenase (NAD+)
MEAFPEVPLYRRSEAMSPARTQSANPHERKHMEIPRGTIDDSLLIDNTRIVPFGKAFVAVDDSYTEQEIARVRSGTAADVDRAFESAHRAQQDWADTDLSERLRVLDDAADLLEASAEALGESLMSEVGTVRQQVRTTQVGSGVNAIRLSVAAAPEAVHHREAICHSTVVREAAGVVGAITPWNYPLFQAALKIAPALAAGCAVVLKPPSVAPLTTFAFAEALASAGLPPGVLNVVCGSGSEVGHAIASHPLADFVSFTGSVPAGRQVAQAAATQGTRTSLELGGKSAALVLDPDMLTEAVRHTLASCFANAGQTCAALSRLIVPRQLLATAESIAEQMVSDYVVGDPRSATTTMGPLSNRGQRDTVLGYIRTAATHPGVRKVAGGELNGIERGWFAPPTVFVADDPKAPIVQEEVFGPVLTIQPHDGPDDAVRLANDTPFGLIARLWTRDPALFTSIAGRLRVGGVIQAGADTVWDAPFGGVKDSGYGRERGLYGVEEYLIPKSLQPLP